MSTTKTLSVTCYSTPRLQNESRKPSFIYFIVIWISFFFFTYNFGLFDQGLLGASQTCPVLSCFVFVEGVMHMPCMHVGRE